MVGKALLLRWKSKGGDEVSPALEFLAVGGEDSKRRFAKAPSTGVSGFSKFWHGLGLVKRRRRIENDAYTKAMLGERGAGKGDPSPIQTPSFLVRIPNVRFAD